MLESDDVVVMMECAVWVRARLLGTPDDVDGGYMEVLASRVRGLGFQICMTACAVRVDERVAAMRVTGVGREKTVWYDVMAR